MDAALSAVISDPALRDSRSMHGVIFISISEDGRTVSETPGVYSEDRLCDPFVHILQQIAISVSDEAMGESLSILLPELESSR